jgi:hypothetical protein
MEVCRETYVNYVDFRVLEGCVRMDLGCGSAQSRDITRSFGVSVNYILYTSFIALLIAVGMRPSH